MSISELERALIEQVTAEMRTRTPEMLAERLGVSLGEIREAEKTALRKLANPGDLDPGSLDDLDLEPMERAVLDFLYCGTPHCTPEEMARRFDVPLLTVLEAQKEAMRHVEQQRSTGNVGAA